MFRHHVKGHIFNSQTGRMVIHDRFFPSFEEAIKFVEDCGYDLVKIYDHNDQLVHFNSNLSESDTKTYA